MTEPSVNAAIEEFILTYHELNGNHVDELSELPSPLEFLQYVRRARPFVVRRGVAEWPAMRWTVEHLENELKGSRVQVAMTPSGNADAVVVNPDDSRSYFVKPLEMDESFTDFIRYIRDQELSNSKIEGSVKYSQAQNDNLRGEYSQLYADVDKDIPWAKVAFGGQEPDAINLWIGNSRSVTALHRDNYENIYCQIIGTKHFVLMAPAEMACTNEKMLPCATYVLDASSNWQLSVEKGTVPFATWDPDMPNEKGTTFSHLSRPLRVDLNAGDLLYLPALWYHKVSQSCSDQGICCAVNYWYDMDFEGMFYASNVFIRTIATLSDRNEASDE